jgi:putative FmdB family regulatory protein
LISKEVQGIMPFREPIMPLYEYRCHSCRRRVTLLRSFSDSSTPCCPECQSENLTRLISRVALLRSEESRLESLADPSSLGDLDENDPRSVARWMRKMSEETGEDMGPEFNEMVGRLEAGENPEDIERSMGELGDEGFADDVM